MKQNVFFHTGDLGDIIASLPAVRACGGGCYTIGPAPGGIVEGFGRESLRGKRFECILPLLAKQPYISSVQWVEDRDVATHDFSTFRKDIIFGEDLAHWQARHLGVDISIDPWLLVEKSNRAEGRMVISRSTRYHNKFRMWQKVVSRNKDAVFVGLPEEHLLLQGETGARIDYAPTENLLELASIIAGCTRFMGNQSCPWWIAFGLGIPTIQEVFRHSPNSRIERDGAVYWLEPPFDL